MNGLVKINSDLESPRKVFIEKVLSLAESKGSKLEITDNSGAWSDGFGLFWGQNWSGPDEAIYQMCRCYVLTKEIEMTIPE